MKLKNGFRDDNGYCWCTLANHGIEYSCTYNDYKKLHQKCREEPTYRLPHGRCMPNQDNVPSWYMFTPLNPVEDVSPSVRNDEDVSEAY